MEDPAYNDDSTADGAVQSECALDVSTSSLQLGHSISNVNSNNMPRVKCIESGKEDCRLLGRLTILAKTNICTWMVLLLMFLFFSSFLLKALQITYICIEIMDEASIDHSTSTIQRIDCAFMRTVTASSPQIFPCNVSSLDLDLFEFSRIQTFHLSMLIYLFIASLTCLAAIPAMKLIALNFVCVAASILLVHSVSSVVLLVISLTDVSMVPLSTLLSISIDTCIAISVVAFSRVHQSHSIMYFKPSTLPRNVMLRQVKLNRESNSEGNTYTILKSIRKIASTASLDQTYRQYDHVDTPIVS